MSDPPDARVLHLVALLRRAQRDAGRRPRLFDRRLRQGGPRVLEPRRPADDRALDLSPSRDAHAASVWEQPEQARAHEAPTPGPREGRRTSERRGTLIRKLDNHLLSRVQYPRARFLASGARHDQFPCSISSTLHDGLRERVVRARALSADALVGLEVDRARLGRYAHARTCTCAVGQRASDRGLHRLDEPRGPDRRVGHVTRWHVTRWRRRPSPSRPSVRLSARRGCDRRSA